LTFIGSSKEPFKDVLPRSGRFFSRCTDQLGNFVEVSQLVDQFFFTINAAVKPKTGIRPLIVLTMLRATRAR